MKHTKKITIILLALFLVTQIFGLFIISLYSPQSKEIKNEKGESKNITIYNLPPGFEPNLDENKDFNFIYFVFGLFFAVILMLLLMKYKAEKVIKGWLYVVISISISITLYALFGKTETGFIFALILGFLISFLKLFRRGVITHNLSEILIYPGIAAVLVPFLNLTSVIILLFLISLYDIYAVWHAGFMQKMAKYQMENLKIFSGFFVPYIRKKDILIKRSESKKKRKISIAILGGGDVVFPILFAGTILNSLGFASAIASIIGATFALGLLFYYSEKGKFYPAMPFISSGCLLGFIISLIML